jgi:DNA-binding response OmpR family regulator
MRESNKLLLADDEDLFRDTTTHLLHRAGYMVDCACDAAEASRMLSANEYDLLISDIRMPGNGELQLVVEANEIAPGLPIILVTGYPAVETAVHAVKMAVVGYLIKPFDLGELLTLVRSSVVRSRLYHAVMDLRKQLRSWDDDACLLEKAIREPLGVDVAEPAKLLLTTTFRIVAKSLVDLRRVAEVSATADKSMRPNEVEVLAGMSETIETALRETIQVLEESKYVFKSKRLKELRQQLQGLVGLMAQGKAAPAGRANADPPHHLHAHLNRRVQET